MSFLEENTDNFDKSYAAVYNGGVGFYRQKRGLIEVSGKEAVMFLNGLITNDVAKLAENSWMLAAFPNAQGRLLAAVRVLRINDKFIFETEAETYDKILKNLNRFILAGDFKVNDLTEQFYCISLRGNDFSKFQFEIPNENEINEVNFLGVKIFALKASVASGFDIFVPQTQIFEDFWEQLLNLGAVEISEETQEILRIEHGEPKYGIDADETTIVPEIATENLISYNKGCYIGQEIIARIHFRGHVAKQLTGLILENKVEPNAELKSVEDKNAGKITSVAFSPKLNKFIALALVRYEFLAEGTELKIGVVKAKVKKPPFIQ